MSKTLRKLKAYYRLMGPRGPWFHYRNKLGAASREVSLDVRGVAAPIRLRTGTSDVRTFQQVFLDRCYEMELTRSPRFILDAGANIGLASVYFANRYPDATIVAVEPEGSNFAVLARNAAPYGGRIVPVQAALWGQNGTIQLVDPGLGNWGFQTRGGAGAAPVLHDVPALTVDRIMAEHGIERFDVAKIDIEGAEKEVFADASGWIGRVGLLAVELHDRSKIGCNRSFYGATGGFAVEWYQGENVCMVRDAADLAEPFRARALRGAVG